MSREARLLAQEFHEAYERLAPEYGYKTRPETAVPWEDVPEDNKALMTAVVDEVVVPKLLSIATLAATDIIDRLDELVTEFREDVSDDKAREDA